MPITSSQELVNAEILLIDIVVRAYAIAQSQGSTSCNVKWKISVKASQLYRLVKKGEQRKWVRREAIY